MATARARNRVNVDRSLTYRDVVTAHLKLLSNALPSKDAIAAHQIDTVGMVLGEWADEPVERFEQHHSFASNDGSPVEFSFAMGRSGTEVRLLFEPLDIGQCPPSPRLAGQGFLQRLDGFLNVDVSRFRMVADLFSGSPSSGSFSMLCSAALRAGGTPLFKVYLNPAVGGMRPDQAVGGAMSRLGLGEQWAHVAESLGELGLPQQEIALFALDLGGGPDARVKVYLRHSGCGPEQVERAARLARDHQADRVARIFDRLYGGSVDKLMKAPMTCLSFQRDFCEPASVTLYCPLDPNMGNDAEASARVVDLLEMSGIPPTVFGNLATALSGTDLTSEHRLSWVSCKQPADPTVTVYAGLGGSTRASE